MRLTLVRDQRALARSRSLERLHATLLARASAESVTAADPFPAEGRVELMQRTLAADRARTDGLVHSIRGLELALQPPPPPVGFASGSSATVGAYAVSIAERYLGVRYLWGGSNPSDGFDCSGFVMYVYAQLGVQLPHYAASQYATTTHVDPSQLEPGDLVFFEPRADGPGHVGMYVGNGVFIEAPHTGDVVKFSELSTEAQLMGFVGASRPAAPPA